LGEDVTMEMGQLRQAAQIVNGTSSLGPGTLPRNTAPQFLAFLVRYYGGQPIVITSATPGPGDGPTQVVIVGTAPFLKVPGLSVTATYTLSADGSDVVATLRYGPLAVTGQTPWRWSTSFPGLPPVYDMSTPTDQPDQPALDRLPLTCADLIVTTTAGEATVCGGGQTSVPVVPGINFVGQTQVPPFVPLLARLFSAGSEIYGTVVPPVATPPPALLPEGTEPWDLASPPPGILLRSHLTPPQSLGRLTLTSVELILYSPPSNDWLDQHPDYRPAVAYVATLSIPSAVVPNAHGVSEPLAVDVTARLVPGFAEVVLSGTFTGVSLANLASLLDIAGNNDLSTHMPGEIAKRGDALGTLSLLEAAVSIREVGTSFAIGYTYFSVGMPDISWTPIAHFKITALVAQFLVMSPFDSSTRSVNVALVGDIEILGVPLEVTVDAGAFRVEAKTTAPVSIPLNTLFTTYAPSLTAPSDLTINALTFQALPGQWYSFDATLAAAPPWTIPVGSSNLTISDVTAQVIVPETGSTSGSFSGQIAFATSSIDVAYDLGGDFVIKGYFPEINLVGLIQQLCDDAIPLPREFDLTLFGSSVLIQDQSGTLTFLLATQVANVGIIAFQVSKTSAGWGFAAGIDLQSVPSTLSGLEALKGFEELFTLQKLMLLVSSLDTSAINFPDMTSFANPNLTGKNITLPRQSRGTAAGFYVFAELTLGDSKEQHLVREFLGLDANATLDATLQVSVPPTRESRLYVSISGEIGVTTFTGQFGAAMQGGEPSLFMAARVIATIDGQPGVEFDALTVFVPNGALLSGTMHGSPIRFWGVSLADVSLEVGIDLEGIPSLGVAATFAAGTFSSSLAIFFDSTDPAKSMIAGSISDVSLIDIVKALSLVTGPIGSGLDEILGEISLLGTKQFTLPASTATALDSLDLATVAKAFAAAGVTIPAASRDVHVIIGEPGKAWLITDKTANPMRSYELKLNGAQIDGALEAQVYMVPSRTSIGSLVFEQGFAASGTIAICGWHATIEARVVSAQGITVDAEADPLIIYSANLLAVTGDKGVGGAQLSLHTFGDPHFYCTGQVKLLGVIGVGIQLSISPAGCKFALHGELVPGTQFALDGSFTSLESFGIEGGASVGVKATLDFSELGAGIGTIALDVAVEGRLDAGYANSAAYARVSAKFEFQSKPYPIAQFDLTIGQDDLANLARTFQDKIQALFLDLLKDAKQWLTWVADGVMEGVDEAADAIGKVLADVYELGAEDIATLLSNTLSYGLDQLIEALKGSGATMSQALAALEQLDEWSVTQIAQELAAVFGAHADVQLHIDQQTHPHLDQAGGPHIDQAGQHTDLPGTHQDQPGVPHHDVRDWQGQHQDTPPQHIDAGQGHADSTTPHGDTPQGPHTDSPEQHQDQPGHADNA
jgi:hypothetical protein